MELETYYENAQRSDLGEGVGYHGLVYGFLERIAGIHVDNWNHATQVIGKLLWPGSDHDYDDREE